MSEPFSRQTWLLRQLGVGGGIKKRLQFYVAQGLVWISAGTLVPSIVAPKGPAAACLALAAALVSMGAGFKLSQVRRHSILLKDLLSQIGVLPGSTGLLRRVGKVSKIYVLFLLVILSAWMAYPWISGDLRLLLPYWTPFETDTFIKFSIVYFFASISLLAVAYTQEAVDTIVLLIAAYICR
ncbi:unnamed protein product [Nezara viridula]|uniref:Uncharacterized protein n=1 Tax=Nezara viridula TaxID=85310 RepID=A0A9P0HP29_NEZVI|nr:unnamed protein product [Nezara viridula]